MSQTPQKPPGAGIPIPKSRRGMKGFISEVSREMRKVVWPTPKETNRLTGIVLAVCFMIVAVLFALSEVASVFVDLVTKGKVG
ncbi:MAG: preprotein translocase subunit SecE [Fimbriimonas ginsengisoli]|nr:preprotein translocase subunit SecE [Fimbriimonas ginsengisoli]